MEPLLGEMRGCYLLILPRGDGPHAMVRCYLYHNIRRYSRCLERRTADGVRTNFALPDLRSKSPFPAGVIGYCIAMQGVFPSRD